MPPPPSCLHPHAQAVQAAAAEEQAQQAARARRAAQTAAADAAAAEAAAAEAAAAQRRAPKVQLPPPPPPPKNTTERAARFLNRWVGARPLFCWGGGGGTRGAARGVFWPLAPHWGQRVSVVLVSAVHVVYGVWLERVCNRMWVGVSVRVAARTLLPPWPRWRAHAHT